MNGVDAALAIQQIAPNMPIIIMSGSGMGDYPKSIKDLRLANTLTKPFTVDHFRTSVRHAINSLNEKQCITPPALNAAFRTSDSAGVPTGMLQIRANMPKEYRDD
jgi:DNA-binding NtrC family response regulator